jgi:hypothetical protein
MPSGATAGGHVFEGRCRYVSRSGISGGSASKSGRVNATHQRVDFFHLRPVEAYHYFTIIIFLVCTKFPAESL